MAKKPLGINVFDAANNRIKYIFDNFEKFYISFSGGKDSTVLLHLVMAEAIKRGIKIGVLFIDLEAQYTLTIEHVKNCYEMYKEHIEPYWICLPLNLRNAVSMSQAHWICWDNNQRDIWVRDMPDMAISDLSYFDFFYKSMEFEEFVEEFGKWYGGNLITSCMVGIRSDESLNRYRTLVKKKSTFESIFWTTWKGKGVYNAYPIYDWKTEDIWIYHAKTGLPYNKIYDLFHKAGLSLSQMRICQPYGDDQRKGLYLYHVLEPATWSKVIARVSSANSGAMYAHETGEMMGRLRVKKPKGHTWQSYAEMLLDSLPPQQKEHYTGKINTFLDWYSSRGYDGYNIPDEADPKLEASKRAPSWRRIVKTILKNDYWCKTLSFGQTKSGSYEKYIKIMKRRYGNDFRVRKNKIINF